MSVTELAWSRIEPFGIRIESDLSQPLGDDAVAQLRSLLWQEQLVVASGHPLTLDQQIAVTCVAGPAVRESTTRAGIGSHVSNHLPGGTQGESAIPFHSDYSFMSRPLQAISLYGIDVEGATTRFANGVRAYARLPRALKSRITGLRALHMHNYSTEQRDPELPDVGIRETSVYEDSAPRWIHPVAMQHPVTCRGVLFVSDAMTLRIEDVAPEVSRELLGDLFSELYARDNVYEHHWQVDDLVLWDNIAVQHARDRVPRTSGLRTLRRVPVGAIGAPALQELDRPHWVAI